MAHWPQNMEHGIANIKSAEIHSRAQGCLMGQAVGDAFGGRYEFLSHANASNQLAQDKVGQFIPILGEGVHNLTPGQITDDTELAMALARSLLSERNYNPRNVAHGYLQWLASPPFDIGNTTRNAFQKARNYQDICNNSLQLNSTSLSNGCLMRICPLGIFGIRYNQQNLMFLVEQECKMTHPNPEAIDAARVYVAGIRTAILTGQRQEVMNQMLNTVQTEKIRHLLLAGMHKAEPVVIQDPTDQTIKTIASEGPMSGYLGIALQQVVYELMNGTDFYSSLVRVVGRGGDTDTNACIVGALLGAIYGIDHIPEQWRQSILQAYPPHRLAQYPKGTTVDILEIASALVK